MKKRYLKCLSLFVLTSTLILTGIGCSNNSSTPTTTPSQSTSDENTNNSLNNFSNNSNLEKPSSNNSIAPSSDESEKNDTENNTISSDNIKLFNMILADDTNVYGLNDNLEDIKISNNEILGIRYLKNSKAYITLEYSNLGPSMYFINSNNEKTLLCSNISKDNFKYFTVEYLNKLYYLTNNNDLYCYNKENNKQDKIESNVYKFNITDNGDIVLRTYDKLCIINTKGDELILSLDGKCEDFYIDNNNVIYLEDKYVYHYDINTGYSEIIEETDIIVYSGNYYVSFNGNDGFLYYINYDYESINDALKYKTYNGNTITIDSNIENYTLTKGGVYYTKYTDEFVDYNNNTGEVWQDNTSTGSNYITDYSYYGDMFDGIYYFDFSTNKSTKILEYNKIIETTNTNLTTAYIKDNNNNVYMISNDGAITKSYGTINQGYEIYEDGENSYVKYVPYTPLVFKEYTVILSTNGNLYLNDSVIATNVDFILSTGDTLAYITKDKKIYLIDENEEIHLIIEDATKYHKVFFNGDLLCID